MKQRGRSPRARRVVPDNLAAEVERSWTRLDELRAQSAATPGQLDDLALQATEELATALEELRVTAEELRVQNAELAEALTELTRERQRYQDLFEHAPDAYVVTDERGLIAAANSAAARLFGVRATRLRGKPLELYLPGAVQRLAARQHNGAKSAEVDEWEAEVRSRAGDRVAVGVRYAHVERDGETAIRWLLRDLTERYRAEQQARHMLQERAHAEAASEAVARAHADLETRIAQRTAELASTNEALSQEIAQRGHSEAARRELQRQLASVEDEERRRISRELHDQMGQLVTALQLGLKSLELGSGVGNQHDRIVELEKLADQIARETQHLALELRPAALDRLGLAPALQTHLEEWAERTSIMSDFHSSGMAGVRLPADVETTVYRVVQEGLTNVLKHAHATRVSLIVERRQGYVSAILEDNGTGFDVEEVFASPAKAQRLGLHGMRERVALLDGTLDVESSPRTGTTLFVRVPDGS